MIQIIMIGISLAMDAFAVSICKGLTIKKNIIPKAIKIAIYFGLFQAIMPLIGYYFGILIKDYIEAIDHWIAFISLSIIGYSMIKEEPEKYDEKIDWKTLLVLAIATSIDALVVGITFAFEEVEILPTITVIGLITFVICMVGVLLGKKVGQKLERIANIAGGLILIGIGLKTLLEHLGII